MKCISCHHFLLPSQPPSTGLLHYKPCSIQPFCRSSAVSLRARALPGPVFVAAANLSDATKINVIVQTGALCAVAFWITNFVMPAIILKDVRKTGDNEDDGNYSEEEDE